MQPPNEAAFFEKTILSAAEQAAESEDLMEFFNSAVDTLQTVWAVPCVSGAASTCWRVMDRITPAAMLMCGKVTNDNLIDSSHYFRNTDQYEKLMWGFSYISFCLSKHFWESDVFVSFLLTASL